MDDEICRKICARVLEIANAFQREFETEEGKTPGGFETIRDVSFQFRAWGRELRGEKTPNQSA